MGQRIKRDLASHGKSRGSRAGEHEQPNAGRKRKRHFFFLRFVGRTLSHARRQGVTRNARTCENRTRKASQETTRTFPDEPKSRPRRSKTPLGAQSGKQKPSQAVPGRSGDAPKACHDAPGWLRGRAGAAPSGANSVRGASGNTPEGGGDALTRKSYAAVAQHASRSALATFFRRLRRFAQTGRHAFRLSFNGVLTEFDEVGVTRARAAWEAAKRSFRQGKSGPGDRPSEQNRGPTAKFERKNGARAQRSQQSAYFLASRTQQGARGSETQARRGPHGASRPSPGMRTFEWKSRGGASRPPRCT